MEAFNLDLIMEILSHSSLETISKSRLLSKECNALTYESFFRDLHSQRAKIVSGLFVQFPSYGELYSQFVSTKEQPALSLDFLPCQVQITASTNIGILLCVNVTPRIPEYYVCKPTTKQYRKLPNPKTRYCTVATGMVVVKSNPLQYKIVRISRPKPLHNGYPNFINYRTEIFDSKTWSWKQMNPVSLSYGKQIQKPAISAGGSLYWPTGDHKTIIAYHQEENCCSTFSLPEEILESSDVKLVEYEGRLAAVCDKGSASMELWTMRNDNGETTWRRRLSMNCEDVRKEERYARCMAYYGNDVALFHGFNRLMFYNMKKKKIDVVRGSSFYIVDLFRFQSDYGLVHF